MVLEAISIILYGVWDELSGCLGTLLLDLLICQVVCNFS